MKLMLRQEWGGVGWGGIETNQPRATLLAVLLHLPYEVDATSRMGPSVNATRKENGHTVLSPVVSSLVHQWVWRQSIGPQKPKQFLQEL